MQTIIINYSNSNCKQLLIVVLPPNVHTFSFRHPFVSLSPTIKKAKFTKNNFNHIKKKQNKNILYQSVSCYWIFYYQ